MPELSSFLEYFNTTDVDPKTETQYTDKAKGQSVHVLQFYKSQPNVLFSPSQVHKWLMFRKKISINTPLTSIRRSISTLTRKGFLIKSNKKITGAYARPEFCWYATDDQAKLNL